MKDFNYSQKINNAKTKEERFKINDEFLKYRRKVRKIENLKKYFIDNILAIITIIIALLDLILTIVALSK